MSYRAPENIVFIPACDVVKTVISNIIVRDMVDILVKYPAEDIKNEALCASHLLAAGFSSGTIFHLQSEARFQAWALIQPDEACREVFRNWQLATRQALVAASLVVRQ